MDNRKIEEQARKLENAIGKCMDKKLKSKGYCQTVSGVVVSVNDKNTRANVKIGDSDKSIFSFLNKTAEKLSVGDYVWIEYFGKLSSGTIARRNGEAVLANEGGFAISNAVVLTEQQNKAYVAETTTTINVDVKNQLITKYGTPRSSIIVQGNMIPYTATTPYDNDKDTDLSAFVDKLVQRLYVGNDVYTVDLESISTETTTYVIKKNGVADTSTYTYVPSTETSYNYGLLVACESISPSSVTFHTHYIYGYREAIKICAISTATNKRVNNYANYGISINGISITSIAWANTAEYNYAVNLTTVSDVAPSEV